MLQYYCEAAGDERLPALFFSWTTRASGRSPGPTPAREADRLAVAIAALGNALPHLRFLRLGEGVAGEVVLGLHIGRMWRKGI